MLSPYFVLIIVDQFYQQVEAGGDQVIGMDALQ